MDTSLELQNDGSIFYYKILIHVPYHDCVTVMLYHCRKMYLLIMNCKFPLRLYLSQGTRYLIHYSDLKEQQNFRWVKDKDIQALLHSWYCYSLHIYIYPKNFILLQTKSVSVHHRKIVVPPMKCKCQVIFLELYLVFLVSFVV